MPNTQPMRKGIAVVFRFGDSRIRIVAVIGTELIAIARASGSRYPNAWSMALPLLTKASRRDVDWPCAHDDAVHESDRSSGPFAEFASTLIMT